MVVQASIRLRHSGCSSEHVVGGARVLHMSADDHHCVSLFKATSNAQLRDLLERNRHLLEPDGVMEESEDWAVVRCHCPRDGSRILPLIREHECTVIRPMVETDGQEFYTVLAPSRKRVFDLVERLEQEGEVILERMGNVSGSTLDVAVNLGTMTQELTRRQLDILKFSVVSGYYERPRRIHAEQLAMGLGMSRSTFQEHLQKAESVVLKTFVDLVLEHPALDEQATKGRGRPKVRNDMVR